MPPDAPVEDEKPVEQAEGSASPRLARGHLVRWLLVTVGVLVAVAAFVWWNAHRLADDTLARHRATFAREKTKLAGRVATRPALVEPFEDGTAEDVAARLLAIVTAVPKAEHERLRAGYYGDDDDRPKPEEEDRILAAHPEALAEWAHLLHRPSRVPLPSLDGLDPTSDRVPSLHQAARWGDTAIRRAVERSDLRAALRGVGELATLGADLERSGSMIALLVGQSIQSVALSRLRLALRAGPVEAGDARALLRALDELDAARPRLVEIFDTEITRFRGLFSPAQMADDPGLHNTGWRHLWSQKIYRAAALDELDVHREPLLAVAANAEADWPKAIRDAKTIEGRVENLLAKMNYLVMPMCIRNTALFLAKSRVARAALAVAVYEAEKGAPPPTLDALVPTWLGRVPVDPWDGKPLRYAAGPPARVWSIGQNEKDDGGEPPDESEDAPDPLDVVMQVGPSPSSQSPAAPTPSQPAMDR